MTHAQGMIPAGFNPLFIRVGLRPLHRGIPGAVRPVEDSPYRNTVGCCRARRAFTLFEVMLVIALMTVAGSMFLVSVESLGKSSPADEFEGAFWKAMAMAREQALSTRHPVELTYDPKEKGFLLAGAGGEKSVPLSAEVATSDEDCKATFSVELPSNDFVLVRGDLVTRRPVDAVRIFPDGSCQAFAVEFELRAYQHIVHIDPWTGAEMLSIGTSKKGRL